VASRTSWIARYLARTPLSPIFLLLLFNEPLDDMYGRLPVLLMLLFRTLVLDLFVVPRSFPFAIWPSRAPIIYPSNDHQRRMHDLAVLQMREERKAKVERRSTTSSTLVVKAGVNCSLFTFLRFPPSLPTRNPLLLAL
jgi:hypothetical protein